MQAGNPVRGVEKARGESRERILSPAELGLLGKVLDENAGESPMAAAALRLVALTGLRREEACALKWSEIDEAGQCLRLEETKTGRSMRPLGRAALDHLRSLLRQSDIWVFPNRNGTGSADLKKGIAGLFDAAGLPGMRSQALRRTFASIADEEGYSEATIDELLGHTRRGVNRRHYIRRPDSALVAAADRVSARIAAALTGRGQAEIIELRPKVG